MIDEDDDLLQIVMKRRSQMRKRKVCDSRLLSRECWSALLIAYTKFRLFLAYCSAFICHIAFPPTREAYLALQLAIKKKKKKIAITVINAYQMR